jgi:hypothetical protein
MFGRDEPLTDATRIGANMYAMGERRPPGGESWRKYPSIVE